MKVMFFSCIETQYNTKHSRNQIINLEKEEDILEIFKEWLREQQAVVTNGIPNMAIIVNCNIIRQ